MAHNRWTRTESLKRAREEYQLLMHSCEPPVKRLHKAHQPTSSWRHTSERHLRSPHLFREKFAKPFSTLCEGACEDDPWNWEGSASSLPRTATQQDNLTHSEQDSIERSPIGDSPIGRCGALCDARCTQNGSTESVPCDDTRDDHWRVGTLSTYPVAVEVIRSDISRRIQFMFRSLITFRWKRTNEFYRSLTGEVVGYELREVVRGVVVRPARPVSSFSYDTKGSVPSPKAASDYNEEEESVMTALLSPTQVMHPFPMSRLNEETAVCGYTFDVCATSRVANPPMLEGVASLEHLPSTTPGLVAEALVRCAAEEASLQDDRNWVLIYRGQLVLSQQGRASLSRDLLQQPATSGCPRPPLCICACRKY